MARASKYRTLRFEVVTLGAFGRVLHEIENATKVRANAAVCDNITGRQFDDEAGDFADFFAFRVVFDIFLLEHEIYTRPFARKVRIAKCNVFFGSWLI